MAGDNTDGFVNTWMGLFDDIDSLLIKLLDLFFGVI
jgi:hypothetical protein